MDVTKPYKLIWFGDIHGPMPYKFIGFRWAVMSQTPVSDSRRTEGRRQRSVLSAPVPFSTGPPACPALGAFCCLGLVHSHGTRSGWASKPKSSMSQFVKCRIIVETRRNRAKIVRNRCAPVCGYRARYFGLGSAQLWGPNPVRNRRFPAGSLRVFGALLAQPSGSEEQPA